MNSKPIKAVLLAVAFILVAGIAIVAQPRWRERQLIRQSEPIQASLESYRQQHGRYPDSLSLVGFTEREEGPIYYRRESDLAYQLWFGTSLGESVTFNSTDREWR